MTKDGAVLTLDPAQLVSMMFALLPVPVAITDERGKVVLCNSCFTDVFQGIPSISTEPQYEMEVSGLGTFQVQTLPLTDQGYKIVFATDVSDQSELRAKVGRLEKMAAIGRAVTGVVNELEAPLADIASYALLVERSNLTPEARQMVGTVLTKAERAAHLVQSLTTLAGVTAARTTLFDLNRIVRNVVDLHRRRQAAGDVEMVVELDANLPEILGDPSQIEQVVLTLLINAEDCVAAAPHSPGRVHVRTCVQGSKVQLHVSDSGFARDAARIFESSESGVGLNICAEIAKDHGGDLYAWSSYESGATLTLELPISSRDCDPSSGRHLKGKTVMVVDDEVNVAEFIDEVLTRQGVFVEIAHSGSEAYECFKTKPYDLVICDRHMPGLSGQGLYRLIQDTDPQAARRFLFLTEETVAADTRQFFSGHNVQFLRKPFKIQELLETVDSLFSRNQSPGS
jgi:two-component system cell cycle sensor histidine kinase/response regulator CckA